MDDSEAIQETNATAHLRVGNTLPAGYSVLLSLSNILHSVEKIHSVGTINNLETSYFTQLKMC